MEKLEAVFKEEKGDPLSIKYPVFEFPYSEYEFDPFNISVPDLLSDKQNGQQLLMNLEVAKARYAAFGSRYLVDTNQVNIKDLAKPTVNTRYIPAKGVDLSAAVVEIPRTNIDGDVIAISQSLQQQASLDIGIDERSLGVA